MRGAQLQWKTCDSPSTSSSVWFTSLSIATGTGFVFMRKPFVNLGKFCGAKIFFLLLSTFLMITVENLLTNRSPLQFILLLETNHVKLLTQLDEMMTFSSEGHDLFPLKCEDPFQISFCCKKLAS